MRRSLIQGMFRPGLAMAQMQMQPMMAAGWQQGPSYPQRQGRRQWLRCRGSTPGSTAPASPIRHRHAGQRCQRSGGNARGSELGSGVEQGAGAPALLRPGPKRVRALPATPRLAPISRRWSKKSPSPGRCTARPARRTLATRRRSSSISGSTSRWGRPWPALAASVRAAGSALMPAPLCLALPVRRLRL